ncbi:MAG: hypothetical protein AB1420_03115 [Bacillota bacterium]
MRINKLPKMFRISQSFNSMWVENVELEISDGIKKHEKLISPGSKIGIAVGSRGIYQLNRTGCTCSKQYGEKH